MSDQQTVAEPQAKDPEVIDDAAMLAELDAAETGDEAGELPAEAEPAEAAPEPEPAKEEPAASGDDDKYRKVQKALSQSRFEARELKRKLAEAEKQGSQPQPDPAQQGNIDLIDFDENPELAVRQAIAFAQHQQRQLAEQQKAEQLSAAEQRQQQIVAQSVQEAEKEFSEATPDYYDALDHFRGHRAAEIKLYGDYSEQEVAQIMRDEMYEIATYAVENGRHPAQMMYDLAKSRGFAGGKQAQSEGQPAPQAQAKLDAMRQAADTPKSPRGGGGGNKTGVVTDEMLMNASGDEFENLWAKFEKQHAS